MSSRSSCSSDINSNAIGIYNLPSIVPVKNESISYAWINTSGNDQSICELCPTWKYYSSDLCLELKCSIC